MVYFVGAGTGAADLITVRGMRLLQKADVIIYAGSLVNPELLDYAGEGCEIYNSAKMTLDEVIAVMKAAEVDGKITVRLHTGEPSIYGAVREQMDELDSLLIPYESCPGVSACFGAAASLNIEYTLPGISQSLIITRMEGRTKVPPKESIASFASHHASMAIYLSTGLLEKLTESLIEGGIRGRYTCCNCIQGNLATGGGIRVHCRYTGADRERAQYHKDSDCACGRCHSSPALREIKTLRTGFFDRVSQGFSRVKG